jgi:hypothetical protein
MMNHNGLLKCKYDCGREVEESKMVSHLHECPNKPKNSLMDLVMLKDANEVYIEQPEWPSNLPRTRSTFEMIKKLGLDPPFEEPVEDDWTDVKPKVRKIKNEGRRPGYR